MKAYLTYFKMRLIHSLQYRTAALAGVATQFFWGFMEIQLYRAFYAEHAEVFPMTLPSLVSYIWLRQAFLALFNTWTFENDLFRSILDGNVAYELLRPTDLYFMW
ncbi:MAG: ABC transporter permease, partial [Clostridia bacterium]|nr:ABC transporter permease [Clostridia bacterium]